MNEAQMREILALELEARDLKVAASCIRHGGAFIANSPQSDAAVIAAMKGVQAWVLRECREAINRVEG